MACPQCGYESSPATEKAKGGKPPFGFKAVDGELSFDQPTGQVLVTLMRWNNHYSTRAIAETCNSQGIVGPSGGEWSHGSVARVIKRGKELTHLIPLEYVL